MSRNLRNILIAILVLVLVGAGIFFLMQRQQAAADPQFEVLREASVTTDRIASTVNATGAIEPESLVTLTFGLNGIIQDVNAVRGQTVAAGDVLARVHARSADAADTAVREIRQAINITVDPPVLRPAVYQAIR